MRERIYFVDESENDRFANGQELTDLFSDTDYEVISEAPRPSIYDYADVVASGGVVAFLLDQNMRVSGHQYDGIELAKFIRNVDSRVPIYIITAATSAVAEIGSEQYLVDDVVEKRDISDPASDQAIKLKSRLLRHIDLHSVKMRGVRNRFGELLRKSLVGALTEQESEELELLDQDRVSDIQVAEYSRNKSIEDLASIVSELALLSAQGE